MVETVDSVVSTKTVERKKARVGQKLLANSADTYDTQFVGRTDSAHVRQKHLADMAELADMADMAD